MTRSWYARVVYYTARDSSAARAFPLRKSNALRSWFLKQEAYRPRRRVNNQEGLVFESVCHDEEGVGPLLAPHSALRSKEEHSSQPRRI